MEHPDPKPTDETETVSLCAVRVGSLFGPHPDSVRFAPAFDPFAPALDFVTDAQSGREIDR